MAGERNLPCPFFIFSEKMYFAFVGFNVVISANKRKVKKFVNKNFPGIDVTFGFIRKQTFLKASNFTKEFGSSIIFDVDQKLKFAPVPDAGFNVLPDYRNIFN